MYLADDGANGELIPRKLSEKRGLSSLFQSVSTHEHRVLI